MKVLNERAQVREVAAKWRKQYPAGGPKLKWDPEAIYAQLVALDVETATADDVAAIMGNRSWVAPVECDECRAVTWRAVQIGQEPDYESGTATVCLECLGKAVSLIARQEAA